MPKDTLSGKFAVILHADVAGSTHMVQKDERLAHERIQGAFHSFRDIIIKYSGHLLELRGDALLAEFERPSDAVAATLAFQAEHSAFLSSLNDDLKPGVRVGIAMGEVIVADNTITGAGVVLAQRVEQLADVGGLCITSAVRESLSRRLPIEFETLGEQVLKGFDEPIRVFRVNLPAGESVPPPQPKNQHQRTQPRSRQMAALAVVMLVAAAGLTYLFNLTGPRQEAPRSEQKALTLPDKPSVAVLPFKNMSGDPQQEYLADGITEDIITELSRFDDLFVISRTSSFVYKDRNVKVQDIGRELGVRYLLEGSVRRSGEDLRITAQLVEAETGEHLWAENYDRHVDDVFAIQDEINGAIVTTLGETLWQAAAKDLNKKPTLSFEAYDYFLRGLEALHKLNKEDNFLARDLFEKARELDPEFAATYRGLAWTHVLDFMTQWVTVGEESLDRALEYTNTANALEPDNAEGYRLLGRISQTRGNYDKALRRFERAIELNPNDGDILASYGSALVYSGRSEEGIKWAREAIRRNPHHPSWYGTIIAYGHYFEGRYDEALIQLNRIETPRMWDHRLLAAAYAQSGNLAKAKEHVAAILAVNPETSISTVRPAAAFKDPADVKSYLDGLRKAGLPE